MKKVLQLFLSCLLIVISIFFYYYYLKDSDQIIKNKKQIRDETLDQNQNNLIRNLRYQVKFDNNTQYIITAELSEIIYKNDEEIVKMQKVTAKFIDQENLPLTITSEKADYNNSNYNTKFSDQIIISYDDNFINSNNLDLNFSENTIRVYNNVVYEGLNGLAKTDNIKIDLTTKKIDIFMNDSEEKVKMISK